MTKSLKSTILFWGLSTILITGLFFDLFIPLGVAVGVIYLFPVLLTYKSPSKRLTYFVMVSGILLTILGYLLSPAGGELWKVISNRALAIIAILSVGTVIILEKNSQAALIKQTKIAAKAVLKAEEASIAKSNFLSSMSHEFRTPLNAIIGFSQLLQADEDLNADQLESVGFMHQAGLNLLALITITLEFSDLQNNLVSHETNFRIDKLIFDVLDELQPLIRDYAINIDSEKVENFPIKTIQSDPHLIKQILAVLVKNAIQYNSDGGLLSINSILTENRMLRVTVTDSGLGLSPDKLTDAFKPFSRLGMENSNHSGMGLGLAKAKLLTGAVHGDIGAYNNPDKGATFWLDIPLEMRKETK